MIFELILSFGLSFLLTKVYIRLAAFTGVVDIPADSRRMHTDTVVTSGGVALFFSIVLASLLFLSKDGAVILLLSSFVVLVGLVDDIFSLSPIFKLTFQIGIASASFFLGFGAELSSKPLSFVFSVLWSVLLMNAFNLVDGLDGLCTTLSAVFAASLIFFGGGNLSLVLLGVLLGFLFYNKAPAKAFLGDSGSLTLGYLFSLISLSAIKGPISLLSFVLLFSLPLSDTVFAFVRRIFNGKNPFSPDREHLHHRLSDKGLSPSKVTTLFSSFALLSSATALVLFLKEYLLFSFSFFFLILYTLIISAALSDKRALLWQEKKY